MTLAEQVIQRRKHKGWTQQNLADETGLSLRTIQRIEKGQTQPFGHSLQGLATAFECTVEELTKSPISQDTESVSSDSLKILNLLALIGMVIPYGHLISTIIYFRKHRTDPLINTYGRRVINFQILWSVVAYGSMVIVMAAQGALIRSGFLPKQPYLLFGYALCCVWFVWATLRASVKIQAGDHKQIYSKTP